MYSPLSLLLPLLLATGPLSCLGQEYPKTFPETVGLNKFEIPFRINKAFGNKFKTWNWNVIAVCGVDPWITETFTFVAKKRLPKGGILRTWQEYLDSDDSTPEDWDLVLPTCQNEDALHAAGLDASVSVFLAYGMSNHINKFCDKAKDFDIRNQMTPIREYSIRKEIRNRLYDKKLNIMDTGVGITKDGPTMAPRLLRYIFHDAMDFNNIVLRQSGNVKFPDEVDDETLIESYLVARGSDGEKALVNPNVQGAGAVKIGGVDGCVLDPMEGKLSSSMIDEVRNSSSLPFFGPDAPSSSPHLNIGIDLVKTNAYDGKVKIIFDAFLLMSKVDMVVLSAAMGMEQFFIAPPMPVTYGRRDRWGLGKCKVKDGHTAFMQTSVINSKDPEAVDYNFEMFAHMGFDDPKLVAALMGTHTTGQIQPCNTGDSGFALSFCTAEAEMLTSKGIKLQFYNPKFHTDSSLPVPGSFFDTTPNFFDNDYFKQLLGAFGDRNEDASNAEEAGFSTCGEEKVFDCSQSSCSRDLDDSHFIVRVNETGYANSFTKRVALTTAEVLMLENESYKTEVESMADDNVYFRNTFADAWKKLIEVGFWEGELSASNPDKCAISEADKMAFCGTPTYNEKVDDMSTLSFSLQTCFQCDSNINICEWIFTSEIVAATPCTFNGVYGTNLGIMQCSGIEDKMVVCPL